MIRLIRKNIGLWVVIFLALIPVLIWALIEPLSFRFSNASLILTSIGQISGLVGMALFALVLILNTRTKFLDNLFYGVNNAYVWHHNLGAIAFSLLLLHPAALVIKFALLSIQIAFNMLITSNFAILTGEIALLLMIFLLILTFFIKLKYQVWKFSHKFLSLSFIFASLHMLFISSDVSNSVILRYYMVILTFAGLWAVLYRTVFPFIFVKKYKYIIEQVNQVTDSLVEITLSPESNKMDYKPGQFLFVKFNDDAIGKDTHPFSMSSSPSESNLRIAVKNLGDFTARLKILTKGTKAIIEGAYGRFSYLNYPVGKKQIWIAGGIGITPFLSMARNLQKDSPYAIDLYYCVKEKGELAFWNELKYISDNAKNFKILPFCSNESGFISADFIKKTSGDLENSEIFICGPQIMMQALRNQFVNLGAKKYNIHVEEFKMY